MAPIKNLLQSAAVASSYILAASWCMAASETPVADATSHASAPAIASEDKEKASLEKHARPILQNLQLDGTAKEAKVHQALLAYFGAWKAWHEKNDAQLKTLWGQFNSARGKQDQPQADEVMGQIDAVYRTFKPQHDEFLDKLGQVLNADQIEHIKNQLTVNKVKVTFNAYGEIYHGLKDDQKAFILDNLKSAREEAMDAGSMTEKSAFFKKYKIRIEAYLTAQGYDVKQSYKDFVAKQKAEMAAKKAAGQPGATETEKAAGDE